MSEVTRVVVIGHGMVGARFVDDLMREADRTGARFDVTVLGEEPYEPYNRLMLSEVIAGRADLASLTLPAAPEHVTVHRATTALEIHRDRRTVVDSAGRSHAYDTLVLATGADAVRPSIPGLGAAGGSGVRVVRTIDDCRELLAACAPHRRIAVLGGGLLGVEIACGLRSHGVDVTLVHRGSHLMDRQIDAPSGRMAAATLADLGIDVRLHVSIARVVRHSGHVTAVELTDGSRVETDLLVVNAGVRPRVDLAQAAGIPVDIGVLVDDRLRTLDDESVAAIGDCAQTGAGCAGLIAPGWEQAARLARDLCVDGAEREAGCDADARLASSPRADELTIVKLKALGLELVALGDPLPDPFVAHEWGARVVTLSDAAQRRSASVAVADGRLVGAVVVGSPRVAADLITAYERGTPIPADPAHLLVEGTSVAAAISQTDVPTALPNGATVCRCNGVKKKDIVDAHLDGACSVEDVAAVTRATTGCGSCTATVCGIVDWMNEVDPQPAVTSA